MTGFDDEDEDFNPEDPVDLPIDGVLDLHGFDPREVKSLVPEYLEECRRRGILAVRIVHGKGTGQLRRTVHAILDRAPGVARYRLASDASGWGATLVDLAPLPPS
jgi:DNA-nicking Smr family endonuclease